MRSLKHTGLGFTFELCGKRFCLEQARIVVVFNVVERQRGCFVTKSPSLRNTISVSVPCVQFQK